MQIAVLGAGAVGLQLGGRLALSGCDVLFVTRRPEAAAAICRQGVLLRDPASGLVRHACARALTGLSAAAPHIAGLPTLLCVRSAQSDSPLRELARRAPQCLPVCCQNGVKGEEELAASFERVIGLVVRQTCTRSGDTGVLATGRGRLVLGPWPGGCDSGARTLAEAFRLAGFEVAVSQHIVEDKWLKLFFNLTSATNALVRREDHGEPAFSAIKLRLLEEARRAFAAAGIRARSCDGRDRSIDQEIEAQRRALHSGTPGRSLPIYNSIWAALHDPQLALEADRHHEQILSLCARFGLEAPTHAALLRALRACRRDARGPECWRAADLLAQSESYAIKHPIPRPAGTGLGGAA